MSRDSIEDMIANARAARAPLETKAIIGDITILADEHMVVVQVDEEAVISIPRAHHGFDAFVAALQKLVK